MMTFEIARKLRRALPGFACLVRSLCNKKLGSALLNKGPLERNKGLMALGFSLALQKAATAIDPSHQTD